MAPYKDYKGTVVERFRRKVNKHSGRFATIDGISSECWVWTGGKDKYGYGALYANGKMRKVHRLAWELKYRDIPKGKSVLHHCDNPSCCRVHHLFLGTQRTNVEDMISKGRIARGECHGKSNLRDKDVLKIRYLYATGKFSMSKLANKYSISVSSVHNIVNRKFWTHI